MECTLDRKGITVVQLKVFNTNNNIYPGVNTPQFSQLEYIIEKQHNEGITKIIPNLGLFGEASTGKTTAVSLLAKALGYTLITFNASGLSIADINTAVVSHITEQLSGTKVNSITCINNILQCPWRPLLLFIDEAHELSKIVQTSLLSILDSKSTSTMEPIPFYKQKETISFDTKFVCFVFATTDTSKLLYPLITRLQSITFDQYTKEDIINIIDLQYPVLEYGAKNVIATCSKLVPRVAIRLAEQLSTLYIGATVSEAQAISFAKNFLGMEENGLDMLDKRILLYLANHKKKLNPVETISLDFKIKQKQKLETKSKTTALSASEYRELNRLSFQILIAEQKISNTEFSPKSRQDISLATRILDMKDLEFRLTFLEKLEFICKTPKGIMLNEKYL